MGSIEVLDCTLRDGAYIVDSRFGNGAIRGIIHKLQNANVEVIECGWLKDKEHEEGSSFYHLPEDILPYIVEKRKDCTYVAMIDWNRYDDSVLPEYDGTSIDAVRVVFPYGKAKEGMEIGTRIREKGYKIYFQAANTLAYKEDDLIGLADRINAFEPEGISIVDTFGAMYEDDLLKIARILDTHLKKNIRIGFHSHNNQQMAFANSMTFVNYFADKDRKVMVDASLCGMGRGAGNTTTELLTSFLNRKYHKNYNLDEILDAIDTYMVSFQEKYKWGYSTEYFIAGTYCCHVNNIAYLLNNHRTSAKDMRNIIASLSPEERLKYDYDLLEEKYVENQNRLVEDEKSIKQLTEEFTEKKILLIAPGKSSIDEYRKIEEVSKEEDVVTIAVNAILPGYKYEYLFFSNKVRYEYAKAAYTKEFDNTKRIILSNVKTKAQEKEMIVNFNRVIKRGWEHFDNAVMCMLRLLETIGAKEVYIAGFDGFKTAYNESYADESLPTLSSDIDYAKLNEEIKDMYHDFVETDAGKMDIIFVTESYFEK